MKTTPWSLPIFTLCWLGCAQAAHITDKLLAGLYEKPASGQQPVQLLASGTPVEVLEEKGGYQRVRLADGTQGWVNGSYITDQKPAQAKLLEAKAQIAGLEEELAEAVARACVPEEATTASGADARDQGASQATPAQAGEEVVVAAPAVTDCGPVEDELADVQTRMQAAARLLGGPLLAPASRAPPAGWVSYWPWVVAALALVTGFTLGMLLIQHRVSKRFGKGLRL